MRNMLWKHEQLWNGQIGDIETTKKRVDLVSDAKLFKSASYWASPETIEFEWVQIYKRLKAGIIKVAM